MEYKYSLQRYQHWYAQLLRLYPKPYHERFGEGMEQTFTDLLREQTGKEKGLLVYVLFMFVETSVEIINQNIRYITMQNITKRLMRWAIIVASILLIPLVLTLLGSGVDGDGWHWTFFDFVFIGTLLFGSAVVYELVARKMDNSTYRAAVGLAAVTSVLLVWINAAVGIIGDDEGFNLLYFGVLAVGLVSALIARFRPHRMARVLFVMAFAQALVPVVALSISNPDTWGAPGVLGVFILNSFFALLFVGSGLLFRRAITAGSNQK